KATFEDFLKRYPHHPLAETAKAALRDTDDEAKHPVRKHSESEKELVASTKRGESHEDRGDQQDEEQTKAKPAALKATTAKRKGLPLVTSLRYWSTPDYTRIAIDVGDEIKYEAGRVPSPDRIYFDLYGSRLASELMGKSYDIHDGLLKKVRVAQYKPNMARVVLEVDNLAEYSAFLLPNPYRLIIDVHGRKPAARTETAKVQDVESDNSNSLTGVPQSRGTKAQGKAAAAKAKESSPTEAAKSAESQATETAQNKKPALPARAEVPLQTSDLDFSEIASL